VVNLLPKLAAIEFNSGYSRYPYPSPYSPIELRISAMGDGPVPAGAENAEKKNIVDYLFLTSLNPADYMVVGHSGMAPRSAISDVHVVWGHRIASNGKVCQRISNA
jgi:hypothetical protein